MIFKRKKLKSQVEKLKERMDNEPYHVVSMVAKHMGVNPGRFYSDVQNTYRDCLANKDFDRMKLVREITEVELSEVIASRIQSIYCNYSHEHKSREIRELMESSGVPMFDTAQSRYLEKNLTNLIGELVK